MIKKMLQTFVSALIIYFSFIDIIPIFYWITTTIYILLGLILTIASYLLNTNLKYISTEEVQKVFKVWIKYKVSDSINLLVLTLVLLATSHFYHIIFIIINVVFYFSLQRAYRSKGYV